MPKEPEKKSDLIERRKHLRYSYETSIWLEEQSGSELYKLKTINVSAKGLAIVTDKKLQESNNIKLHIELPYFLDLITASCRIAHSRKDPDTGLFTFGIELIKVQGTTEQQLVQFLKVLFGN